MQIEQLDSFIELLYSVEESNQTLTADQVQKLQLIQTKVSELVKKVDQNFTSAVQTVQQSIQPQPVAQPALAPALAQVSEKRVKGFEQFVNEKIVKHGDEWLVKDSKGKKTLGTHSSKKKAIKQLQAIEISKSKAGK